MKRFIYLGIIVSMLLLIVFPPAVSADTGAPKAPWDWLSPEEQQYAAAIRSGVSGTKELTSDAVFELPGFFTGSREAWYEAMLGKLKAVNNSVYALQEIPAPVIFDVVQKETLRVSGVSTVAFEMFASPQKARKDLAEAVRQISYTEEGLGGIDKDLDKILALLEKTITEVGNERGAVQEAVNQIIMSCLEET